MNRQFMPESGGQFERILQYFAKNMNFKKAKMKVKDLSLADLKAAYDFILIELTDFELKAKDKNVKPEKIPTYLELKEVESILYDELLNRTNKLF